MGKAYNYKYSFGTCASVWRRPYQVNGHSPSCEIWTSRYANKNGDSI